MTQPEPAVRRWTPGWPVDLRTTLGPLARGHDDPTMRITPSGVWRATRTPEGPVTIHYSVPGTGTGRSAPEVACTAWGPGAAAELAVVPQVLGADDDPTGFDAQAHPVMAAAWLRYGPGWRVLRTGRVLEALVPAILEQRVTGPQARSAWSWLVRQFGDPAPAADPGMPAVAAAPSAGAAAPSAGASPSPQAGRPPALVVPPDGPGWARIPSWAWHRAGVDPARAGTIVSAARRAGSLEQLSERDPAQARAALRSLPGVGMWTAAEVAVRAWGDVDAVSFGDFHLARTITHALTGRLDGTDEMMAALLVPWAGQRARAVRLLELHVGMAPRRGPRAPIEDHRGR